MTQTRATDRFILLTALAVVAQLPAAAAESDPAELPEEIVVTAQRREQPLSKVPATIDAFGEEALKAANVRQLADVATQTSNVQIFDLVGTGMPVWVIRGVGIVDFNPNNTPTAAVYVDDVYQTSSVFGALSLFDIERVEVLKGPQGGLYGRNTTGGAVRVMTRAPDLAEAVGQGSLSVDQFGRMRGDLSASVPLVQDVLATRLSGHIERSSGSWQRLAPTSERYGALDAYALRGQALYEPDDSLSIRLILDGARDQSEIPMPRALGVYSAAAPGEFPAFCPAVQAGHRSDSCLTFAQAVNGTGGDPRDQSRGAERVLADPFSRNDTASLGATLNIDVDLQSLTLTSITGYRDFKFRQRQDADAVAGEWGHLMSNSAFDSFSQELRLRSDDSGRLDWVLGASYAIDTLEERRLFPSRDNAYFVDLLDIDPLLFHLEYDQKTTAVATFGRIDYELTDALEASVELRYTDEEKSYDRGLIGFLGVIDNIYDPPLSRDYELAEHWTGKVGLSWTVTPDSLIYASVSRGTKSGGFFGGFVFTPLAVGPYGEEKVWAYEAGTKNTWFDGRAGLAFATFFYDYADVQSFYTIVDPVLGTTSQLLGNIGDAEHIGAELELYVTPIERMRLGGSLAYLDAQIVRGSSNISQDGQIYNNSGFKRDFAPEWSWTANATYSMPTNNGGALNFHADVNGRSALIRSFGSAVDKAIFQVKGYTLANARLSYESPGEIWEAALFAKNIFDKTYKTLWGGDGDGSYFEVYGEPFTFGLELRMRW